MKGSIKRIWIAVITSLMLLTFGVHQSSAQEKIVFVSEARVAPITSADLGNSRFIGLQAIIDITNITGEGTVSLDTGESTKADGTVVIASVLANAFADGTVTFVSALAGDDITVNGLLYTGVTGTKANNTEFSIDVSNTAAGIDLADSINNDVRTGTAGDISANETTGVVTFFSDLLGVLGNAVTLVSSNGTRMAVTGSGFLSSGIDADTVVFDGKIYTAVSGAKSNDTEFSIDVSDENAATDLADSIDDDVRNGTSGLPVAATATTDTVTITAGSGGTVYNALTLVSSSGTRLAVSAATLEGGLDNAFVSGITANAIQIMSGTEVFDTDLETTATNVAANITAHTSVPNYNAVAVGDTIEIESESGGDSFAIVSTATVITTTDVNINANDLTFTIQGKDKASGKYYTLLASAVLNSVTTIVMRIHPDLVTAANLVAKDGLPPTFRIVVTQADDSSVTYSVGVNMLN